MEILSIKFLGIMLIALALITFRAKRKRKGPTIVQGKQISINGQKVTTEIGITTPLPCLLEEGKIFGENFKDKTPPSLPHTVNCTCRLISVLHRSHDWFNEISKEEESFATDLGNLDRMYFRFYKYLLISNHPDADERTKKEYQELADGMNVVQQSKTKALDHIRLAPAANPVRKT
jgi:hypothetical protein